MRLVTGGAALAHGIAALVPGPAPALALFHVLCAVTGLFLIAGLCTPIVAAAATFGAILHAFANPADVHFFFLLATLCGAIALLGPGVWSVDARLFGWRRIEIPDRPGASVAKGGSVSPDARPIRPPPRGR